MTRETTDVQFIRTHDAAIPRVDSVFAVGGKASDSGRRRSPHARRRSR